MKPYYVDSISTYDGDEVKTFKPSSYASVMSAAEAETIGNYMVTTVKSGTASALSGASYTAAGKPVRLNTIQHPVSAVPTAGL